MWLEEHLRTHAFVASVPVTVLPLELSALLAIVMVEAAECSPNRSVFEIGYIGDNFFYFINLILLLGFDGLISSNDLIFRHEKGTSGWRENRRGLDRRVGRRFAFDTVIVKQGT